MQFLSAISIPNWLTSWLPNYESIKARVESIGAKNPRLSSSFSWVGDKFKWLWNTFVDGKEPSNRNVKTAYAQISVDGKNT